MDGSISTTAQGEKFSPTVRYVVIRSKTVPISVHWSFLLFVWSLPFESLDVGFAPNSLSVSRLIGLLFFGCYLLFYNPFLGKRPFPRPCPAVCWFLGYLAIYLMSALFIDPQFAEMAWIRVVTVLQLVVLLWITTDLLKNQKMRKSFLFAYPMSAVYLALGVIFGLPGMETRTGLTGRMTAIGQDENLLAGIMALAVVILIGLSMQTVFKYLLSKILLSVMILPLLLAIVKTGSRTGTLTVLIGSLMYLLPYRRSKRAVIVVILATCGVGFLVYLIATNTLAMKRWQEAREGDLSTRERVLPTALGMISERPIFGWHPVEFAYEIGARIGRRGDVDVHNLFLSILGEMGLIGIIPFINGLLLCFRAAWTALRGDLGLMPLALLSAVLALNMGVPALLWKPFWLAMGLTLAAAFTTNYKTARYKHVSLVHALLKKDVLRAT